MISNELDIIELKPKLDTGSRESKIEVKSFLR
jgi:hypothetical protein